MLGFDPHLAIQAHGILGDLMLDGNLPTGVVQKLHSVQQLLAPRVTRNIPVAQHLVRTSIQHDRTDHELSLQSYSSGSSIGSIPRRQSLLVRHQSTQYNYTIKIAVFHGLGCNVFCSNFSPFLTIRIGALVSALQPQPVECQWLNQLHMLVSGH